MSCSANIPIRAVAEETLRRQAVSTTSAAVCCTLAYVCWREGVVGAPAAFVLAIGPPLLIGASRVYLNVHWATDVLAGWTAGLFIAALAALVYDRVRRQPTAP